MLAEYIGCFYQNIHIWCRTVRLLNTLHLKSHSVGYSTFLCKKIKYFPAVEIGRSRGRKKNKKRSNKLYVKIKLYNLNLKRTELSTEEDNAADFYDYVYVCIVTHQWKLSLCTLCQNFVPFMTIPCAFIIRQK